MRVFQRLLQVRSPQVHPSPQVQLSTPLAAVGARRQSVVLHHLLPPSLAPRFPWEGNWGVRWGGPGQWEPSWAVATTAGSELQLYYVFYQSESQVTAWFRWVGQSKPRGCRKPAKTRKVISPVTATNWNHDVSGGGDDCIINKWQGSICRVDKPY